MRLRILAVGSRMPAWVTRGFEDYARRMPPQCRVELVEIPPGRRGRGLEVERAVRQEGERLLRALRAGDRVVALAEHGQSFGTRELSERLGQWLQAGGDLAFLIGGPDGLDRACLDRAGLCWSISPLTLPHGLVRIVLAEQLYRAWSILSRHPYHRV